MAASLTATGVVEDSVRTTAMAWGRLEDNALTGHANISGVSTTTANSGKRRIYVITMSPVMSNVDYAVVTNGYSHEANQVEGSIQWTSGTSGTLSDSQFQIRFDGNGTQHIDIVGFAVFGA
jgi:hypothetical protein|tara:strand:- start:510 stop:872 length:363 start_codon:yes stop_codon:yes gene_type:complete